MVCRASAGSSAPAIGSRLQVRSGLTGESVARRQLLRCDNAETDARVNLEACRALGIASIVVLPLLRHNGEVRGLFELFSDHAYAFEERDLIALERMAALTLTALDLAEQRQTSAPAPEPASLREKPRSIDSGAAGGLGQVPLNGGAKNQPPENQVPEIEISEIPAESGSVEPRVDSTELGVSSLPAMALAVPEPPAAAAPVPAAMLRVQKCAACGFPVSEGRTLCLDCESKQRDNQDSDKKQRLPEPAPNESQGSKSSAEQGSPSDAGSDLTPPGSQEFVPAFLANAKPAQESWLANHVNLLAIAVLLLGIVVAVVVFR
jgi:hypothetical protein